ncbi:hypothetical protein [Roseibium sp. RKSG952]|uniref:hypothetical protein n=1 Tax=Roseibium sp. RKSG952 TaxID=2529384 RepID=UPI0012BC0E0E|nr:hypothetical protein [Roseibium sp. RKSG952]MTI01199.1 hypothetical protein [Roseibium sp. RKSG952]
MFKLATTTSLLLLQFGPAYSEAMECSPWIVDGKTNGDTVSIDITDQQLIWTDGHVEFKAPMVDETPLGQIFAGHGEVYFAYLNRTNSTENVKSKPRKVVRIPQDQTTVRFLTLNCGEN